MAASTTEGQDFLKRQRCNSGVPISTRYEASTITTYHVSYSYYTPLPRSTEYLPETPKPSPTTYPRPGPPVSIERRTSTTWLPPRKSAVTTASEVVPKPRAIQGIPVTITRTIVTRVPVETIYSCPAPSSYEASTGRDDHSTLWSSRVPLTSREPHTSRERSSRSNQPTSWRTNTTESSQPPSTRHRSTTSSSEPWNTSSSMSSSPTSRSRPVQPPSTSLPPSTRPTPSVPPRTSAAPNPTITHTLWPHIVTSHFHSECVYTLFDGTVPYGNYTAPCTSSTASGSWCTSFHRSGEWALVPCTLPYTNISSTTSTSTLTDITTSTQTITSWPCSSYVPSWEAWVGVSCTSSINVTSSTWPCSSYATSLEGWVSAPCASTMPNTTVSSVERCSSFLGSRSGWAVAPCTSTPSTITSTPIVTIPTLTYSRSCSTYVEDLKTWLPMACDTITTAPTIITTPSITITHNLTETLNITVTPTITETPITERPTITRGPTASHSRHCSTYISALEVWIPVRCTTASPIPLMCLNDDRDVWVPCASITRTSDTDTLTRTITGTSDISPSFLTGIHTPHDTTSQTRPPQTSFPTISSIGTNEPTFTVKATRTEETETHTLTPRPSTAASIGTSDDFTPAFSQGQGSSLVVENSGTRGTSNTQEGAATGGSTDSEPTRPASASTGLAQSPPSQVTLTSTFMIPIGTAFPSPSSTITITPGGIQGGALAGIIIGTILGVVGLLGLGAFIMKSLGGNRGHDLFGTRGGYQAAGGGSVGSRDSSGGEGGGGGSSAMRETRNASPLRSALRNRNMAGGSGGWSDVSWNQAYAYTGIAAAAAVAATTANNHRGRHSEASDGYADGGIRDEDTPDAVPRRYADGGLTGPDPHYDTGISNHPYVNQDQQYLVSNSEVQFDPYHDLPVRQDSVPAGGNIARQSAYTTTDISFSPPGPTTSYYSPMQPQNDTGVFISNAGVPSTTSFTPSSIDQPIQPPAPSNAYQNSPPYARTGSSGVAGATYQSPEPLAQSDIQRPPYWEGSVAATSVDSLPQHGNIPRYSAFTDAGNTLSIGGSQALGTNNTPGIGRAPSPAPAPGAGGGALQGPTIVSPTWNLVGVTEFGQNVMGSSSTQVDGTCISGSAAPDAPDAPRNLHQSLTRLSTELASTEGRDIDASSPRSASRASTRPPRVGGPRMRPPRTPSSMSRLDSRRSLPPAYEERHNDY